MTNVLHIDDSYQKKATSFSELRDYLFNWNVELIPAPTFSEATVDTFLNDPDSSRCILLDIRDQDENQGRGGAILAKFHDLASIILFTGDDGVWADLKPQYGNHVGYVPKPISGAPDEIESTAKEILKQLPDRVRIDIRAAFASEFVDEQLGGSF